MPLTAAAMATAIQAQLDTAFPANTPSHEALALAIATAVVAQIQSSALVTLTTAVVTTGAGAGGTVVGTGTVS